MDALKKALADPYYQSDVQPDEAKFIDAAKSFKTVGREELKIENNDVIRKTQ